MSDMKNWLKLMESVEEATVAKEEQQPVEETTEETVDEQAEQTSEELAFENWSVIYDSVNAKNVKANVRMKKDMDEEAVREWFQRTFNPLGIQEMTKIAELSPKTLGSYVKKASVDAKFKGYDAGAADWGGDEGGKHPSKKTWPGADMDDKAHSRLKGVAKAVDKMTAKMGEDQIDEFGLGDLAGGAPKPGSVNPQISKATATSVKVGDKNFTFGKDADAQEFASKVKKGEIAVEGDRDPAGQYSDLSDVYEPGATEVWYWKEDAGRDMMMGKNFLVKYGKMPDPNNLEATHVKIGSVKETNPEKIFMMMQGENWSPEGQARSMIRSSGTGHTSMSVGDIVVVNGEAQMVDRFGFTKLDDKPTEESRVMEGKFHNARRILAEAHDVKLNVRDDHEVSMAQAELYRLAKDAIALHNMLDEMANLEGWVSAKITLATDYVGTVRDYLEHELAHPGEGEEGEEVVSLDAPAPEADMPSELDMPREAKDDFDDEEDEVVADPDQDKIPHIVMQIKKAYDVGGNYPIVFKDGTKHKLSNDMIAAFLNKYMSLKPMDRETMQDQASKSLLDFQAAMESMDESVENKEAPIDVLARIVRDKQADKVNFADGSSMKVDLYSASAILGVYHNLKKEETKAKLRDMIGKKAGFLKALDFALSNSKFQINK